MSQRFPSEPTAPRPWKPTRQQLLDAVNKTLPDVIAPELTVLFVGINPGLYTAAVGHHFARPGNRFWPALHAGGFTPRLFSPFEELLLPPLGYGITNVVARATATADQLTPDELRASGRALRRKVLKYRPRIAAVVGVGAYRVAFDRPRAQIGRQPDEDRIGETIVWLLPNPSGLNAHYQPADLPEHGHSFAMNSIIGSGSSMPSSLLAGRPKWWNTWEGIPIRLLYLTIALKVLMNTAMSPLSTRIIGTGIPKSSSSISDPP